jgi:hypothetical protein
MIGTQSNEEKNLNGQMAETLAAGYINKRSNAECGGIIGNRHRFQPRLLSGYSVLIWCSKLCDYRAGRHFGVI